jgi:hypothetical protein
MLGLDSQNLFHQPGAKPATWFFADALLLDQDPSPPGLPIGGRENDLLGLRRPIAIDGQAEKSSHLMAGQGVNTAHCFRSILPSS